MADVPNPLAGETLAADTLRKYGTPWQSFTPDIEGATTDPTLGTGALQQGIWSQSSNFADVILLVRFGTSGTSAGSGAYSVTLPPEAPILDIGVTQWVAGYGVIDDGASTRFTVIGLFATGGATDRVQLWYADTISQVTHAAPWAWGVSDEVYMTLRYPADF